METEQNNQQASPKKDVGLQGAWKSAKSFLSHPTWNGYGFFVGIIGLALSFYFYRLSIRERELTYYISPTRTPIVQKGKLENFEVKLLGNPIQGDLSSAEIQLWNAGKESIRREHILKPITISTPSNQPIYQVTIKGTRDIISFNYLGGTNGTLALDWHILEHNDGLKVQLIYGGGVEMPLLVEGVIEGQKELVLLKSTKNKFFDREFFNTMFFFGVIFCSLFLFRRYLDKLFDSLYEALPVAVKKNRLLLKGTVYFIGLALLAWLFIIAIALTYLFATHINAPIKPPFGL